MFDSAVGDVRLLSTTKNSVLQYVAVRLEQDRFPRERRETSSALICNCLMESIRFGRDFAGSRDEFDCSFFFLERKRWNGSGQAEVDKARATAQRALQQIGFREEQEKFNVWIAWLNLEHMYGTTEAYDNVFQVRRVAMFGPSASTSLIATTFNECCFSGRQEALRCNDPLKVYRQMALNLERAQQADAAEAMHQTILKKFGKQDRQVGSLCFVA